MRHLFTFRLAFKRALGAPDLTADAAHAAQQALPAAECMCHDEYAPPLMDCGATEERKERTRLDNRAVTAIE